MPAHNRIWLDQDQGVSPSRPQSPQSDPKEAVGNGKSRLRMAPGQNCQLLPQGEVF
jgi:hypothetical protein